VHRAAAAAAQWGQSLFLVAIIVRIVLTDSFFSMGIPLLGFPLFLSSLVVSYVMLLLDGCCLYIKDVKRYHTLFRDIACC